MYTERNFKTKKQLKEAVAAGDKIGVYQPNDIFNTPIPKNGTVCVEGPHFVAHTWYASVILKDGFIINVK